ncbi:MAG: c-type cytochrome [bacterium]|nr:c-type cytochrome [bacterium]
MPRRFVTVLLPLLVWITACTGLGGEPRIVASLPPPTALPTEVGYPVQPPDLVRGAAIYAANCTRCHGLGGAGDGELVASGQVQNVASFLDPATASRQRPTQWHATITNGVIANLMPPWRDALTEQERWDVGLYTYTLHYTADQVARGRTLYAQNCAECHGERGLGDGRRAAEFSDVGNLQHLPGMVTLSDSQLYNIINEGVGDMMPAYGGELSEADLQAVAAFTRTLSLGSLGALDPAAQTAPVTTAEPAAPAQTAEADAVINGTISGRVVNATNGGQVPAAGDVTLFAFLPESEPLQLTTPIDAAGAFTFDNIPLQADGQYVTTFVYRDRVFTSPLTTPMAGAVVFNLPVTIYELTEDPSVIQVAGLVTQANAIGENLEVVQIFSLRNTSDRAFSTSEIAQNGQPISVVLSLPPGAVVTGLGGSQQRYVVLPEEYLILDTAPVLPGEDHIVQVVYLVPYGGSAIIEQPLNYAVNGNVRLLVRPLETRVQSDQLPPLGTETIGSTQYQAYGGLLDLQAGDVIRFDVSGGALSATQRSGGLIASNNLPLIIGIGILGEIVLIAALYAWYRQRRARRGVAGAAGADLSAIPTGKSPGDPAMIDALIRQIAELDAAHEKGDLPTEAYQQQRNALKARLADLMSRD